MITAIIKTMSNINSAKCVIYCRVSSREQEETGYSLSSQNKTLEEYSIKKEFGVAKTFSISESASGKKQRQIFDEMMSYVKKNNIKIIVCEKADRFTRNFKDAVALDEWLGEDEERQLHLVKNNLILHKNSRSQEKLTWGINVILAKNFIDNLSEEVKKGQKEKLAQGWLPYKSPLGYKTIGEEGHKTHIIDEAKAPLLKKAFELYSTGNYSGSKILEIITNDGLRNTRGNKISLSRLYVILGDPFYCGKIRWMDKIYEGRQEPLVSNEIFDEVQKKLKRGLSSPQYKKHFPIFKALIKCEGCGGTVTWETQKGHWYGHCNHYKSCPEKKSIKQEAVEEALFPYFDKVVPKNQKVLEWLEKALKESHTEEINYTATKRDALNQAFDMAQKRLDAIYEDKIDGVISKDDYTQRFNKYTADKENILSELSKLNSDNTKYYEAGYAIHELANKAAQIYQSPKATVEDKRLLLSYIFSNCELEDGKIKANYTLAFEFLAHWVPKLNNTFEPIKITSNITKNHLEKPKMILWQAGPV